MRTPADLARFISEQRILAEMVPVMNETPTVPLAAAALGVSPAQIVKSLVFEIRDEVVLVIAAGDQLVNRRAIASRFGVGKKQVKLAEAETVLYLTGYPVGGVPPFGHATRLPVLLDEIIRRWEVVYGGGGDDHTLLKVTPAELLRVTVGEWIQL
jgi:prolyl-tRNA editing enzyme YbaK/EbsC (Cys-tRNA(Pro) deacylase)